MHNVIATNFESNGLLVRCLMCNKSGWGNSIPFLPEVIKSLLPIFLYKTGSKFLAYNALAKRTYQNDIRSLCLLLRSTEIY